MSKYKPELPGQLKDPLVFKQSSHADVSAMRMHIVDLQTKLAAQEKIDNGDPGATGWSKAFSWFNNKSGNTDSLIPGMSATNLALITAIGGGSIVAMFRGYMSKGLKWGAILGGSAWLGNKAIASYGSDKNKESVKNFKDNNSYYQKFKNWIDMSESDNLRRQIDESYVKLEKLETDAKIANKTTIPAKLYDGKDGGFTKEQNKQKEERAAKKEKLLKANDQSPGFADMKQKLIKHADKKGQKLSNDDVNEIFMHGDFDEKTMLSDAKSFFNSKNGSAETADEVKEKAVAKAKAIADKKAAEEAKALAAAKTKALEEKRIAKAKADKKAAEETKTKAIADKKTAQKKQDAAMENMFNPTGEYSDFTQINTAKNGNELGVINSAADTQTKTERQQWNSSAVPNTPGTGLIAALLKDRTGAQENRISLAKNKSFSLANTAKNLATGTSMA